MSSTMTKITIHADYADAPKRQLLRDLNIAFANADVEAILAFFTEDIHWHIIGENEMRGKAAVRQALEAMQGVVTREFVIHSIITQGREGAINGLIITEEGGQYAFCDVCQFDSPAGKRIQSMMSYTLEIKSED
ncbi:MAG: nuclear transport factor 2 family protein [Chloroflexi bacterium]|nr:nuclear transport factor 2 family protein [Chloroflexota bacterium]